MSDSALRTAFERLNIPWTEEKEQTLLSYMDRILERNRQVNLTAITDREQFIEKHIIDSLACAGTEAFGRSGRIIDVGTGGGFPGVPLAVAFPEKSFILLDSLNKRVKIVDELCRELGIVNVTAVHGRAEDLARQEDFRDGFDLCVSRAVANMSTLCELCLPFLRVGGTFIAYKGEGGEREVEEAGRAIELLGGQVKEILYPAEGRFMEEHCLVQVEKLRPTDPKYPRRAGLPGRKPL
ncbi:MAG: 16S rRNA (guanine(527)-N(7))-methyltransferase RsmG [Firmicutes bacterium]|nr:16S rRNA (guanine(527)-N(7))-methyltransferase RsmG [Bacillota bacterium]